MNTFDKIREEVRTLYRKNKGSHDWEHTERVLNLCIHLGGKEKADLEVSLFSLEERVNNLFFGVLLIDEQIAQLEILKSTLLRNRKRVEIAVENGTAYNSDIDEIQVEVINADQKMEELNSNRRAYINVLAAMIGTPLSLTDKFTRPVVEE